MDHDYAHLYFEPISGRKYGFQMQHFLCEVRADLYIFGIRGTRRMGAASELIWYQFWSYTGPPYFVPVPGDLLLFVPNPKPTTKQHNKLTYNQNQTELRAKAYPARKNSECEEKAKKSEHQEIQLLVVFLVLENV